jgi:hypothetical protein
MTGRRALALAIALLACTTLSAQIKKPWTPPRTPWGVPDLQGVWTSDDARSVPMQRPAQFGDRRILTDEEFAERKRRGEETPEKARAPSSAKWDRGRFVRPL